MVKPGRVVLGKALGVGGAALTVLALAYIFRKSQAGTDILASLRGAGQFGGQAIITPIEGLISGVAAGTGSLVQTTAALGANFEAFKRAVSAFDWGSIIDGSYITKYGGTAGNIPVPTNTIQDYTKTTIMNEQPNDKSSIQQNFKPTPQPIRSIDLTKPREVFRNIPLIKTQSPGSKGLYDLPNTARTELLPLSQAAIDYYKKLGITVKKIRDI